MYPQNLIMKKQKKKKPDNSPLFSLWSLSYYFSRYFIMQSCWAFDSRKRPSFPNLTSFLGCQLADAEEAVGSILKETNNLKYLLRPQSIKLCPHHDSSWSELYLWISILRRNAFLQLSASQLKHRKLPGQVFGAGVRQRLGCYW